MSVEEYFVYACMFLGVAAIGINIFLYAELEEEREEIARLNRTVELLRTFEMYDERTRGWAETYNLTRGAYGVAYGDYFCVWTKDRDITSVLDSCAHEYAHNNLGLVDARYCN